MKKKQNEKTKRFWSAADNAERLTRFVTSRWAALKSGIGEDVIQIGRADGLDDANILLMTAAIFDTISDMAKDAAREQRRVASRL